jgi:histidyl-tRNA synthetase
MRSADKSGAAFALIIGEDELKAGTVAVKPLKEKGEQRTVPFSEVPATLAGLKG